MLSEKEVAIMRDNAKIHKKVFDALKAFVKPGITAKQADKLAGDICEEAGVLAGFKWVYGFPNNLCLSINDVVVHGLPRDDIIFKDWDVATFDFGVKDKKLGINTDAAFSMIVWEGPHDTEAERLLKVTKKALHKWIEQARAGNKVWDIGNAIQTYVEKHWFHIVKDLTGHGIGKKLHEEPYIYNYGIAGTGRKLKKWMTLAIEPIVGQSSWEITDKWGWEIYIKDGSLWCQFEHTILITDWEAEIII